MFFSRNVLTYYILRRGPDQSMDINSLLGIKSGAGPDEIKQAYRDLVQVWHPDRFAGNPRLQKKAEETLKKINLAYASLPASSRNGGGPRAETRADKASGTPAEKVRPAGVGVWRRMLLHACSNLFNSIALECSDFGRPAAARRFFIRSLKKNPGNTAAHYNLGLLNYDLGFYREALKYLDRAAALDPEFADAYYSRGMVYWKEKDYGRASRDFTRALQLDPGNKNALIRRNLSNIYLHRGTDSRPNRH